MIDWIRSWFGKGKIRTEWKGIDQWGNIRSGDAKCPYVGSYNESVLLKKIKQEMFYQHGVTITEIHVVAHIQD